MAANRRTKKKHFTVEQANAMLPLVSRIVRDITVLAETLKTQHGRLAHFQEEPEPARQSELDEAISAIETTEEHMRSFARELEELNVELKDYFTGLVDFPGRVDGRDVYLCWRLGEPEVAHWHELDAGFTGRQKLAKVSNC